MKNRTAQKPILIEIDGKDVSLTSGDENHRFSSSKGLAATISI